MIARTVILVLALINNALSHFGYSVIPIEDETIEAFVTSSITIAATLWNWWKNNSITKNAKEADKYLASLKQSED